MRMRLEHHLQYGGRLVFCHQMPCEIWAVLYSLLRSLKGREAMAFLHFLCIKLKPTHAIQLCHGCSTPRSLGLKARHKSKRKTLGLFNIYNQRKKKRRKGKKTSILSFEEMEGEGVGGKTVLHEERQINAFLSKVGVATTPSFSAGPSGQQVC